MPQLTHHSMVTKPARKAYSGSEDGHAEERTVAVFVPGAGRVVSIAGSRVSRSPGRTGAPAGAEADRGWMGRLARLGRVGVVESGTVSRYRAIRGGEAETGSCGGREQGVCGRAVFSRMTEVASAPAVVTTALWKGCGVLLTSGGKFEGAQCAEVDDALLVRSSAGRRYRFSRDLVDSVR